VERRPDRHRELEPEQPITDRWGVAGQLQPVASEGESGGVGPVAETILRMEHENHALRTIPLVADRKLTAQLSIHARHTQQLAQLLPLNPTHRHAGEPRRLRM